MNGFVKETKRKRLVWKCAAAYLDIARIDSLMYTLSDGGPSIICMQHYEQETSKLTVIEMM
jgi:homoserine kinase